MGVNHHHQAMKLPAKLRGTSTITAGKLAVFCNSVILALQIEESVRRSGTKALYGCAVVNRKTYYWCHASKADDPATFQPVTFQRSLL